MDPKPDQADVVRQNTQLTADLETRTTERNTAQTLLSTVTAERDTLRADLGTMTTARDTALQTIAARDTSITSLTTERDTLRTQNGALQTQMADFNTRLATELTKHGIRLDPIKQPKTAPDMTKNADGSKNWTLMAMNAKGQA